MILNPWVILGILALVIASHAFAFTQGMKIKDRETKAELLEAQQKVIELAARQEKEDSSLETKAVEIQEKVKIEYRYIREKANANIEKNAHAYAECGLDDAGLLLYNARPGAREIAAPEPPG